MHRGAVDRRFDIIRQGGMVSLDPCRAQALEHVKNSLELEESRRRSGTGQIQPAQVLEFIENVHERRVERRVQQAQVEVGKCGHRFPTSGMGLYVMWKFFLKIY